MKWNLQLTWAALIHIVILALMFWHISTLRGHGKGGDDFIYILIIPAFYLIYIPIIVILTYKNRKDWFDITKRLSTFLLLLICSPLLFVAFNYIIYKLNIMY